MMNQCYESGSHFVHACNNPTNAIAGMLYYIYIIETSRATCALNVIIKFVENAATYKEN